MTATGLTILVAVVFAVSTAFAVFRIQRPAPGEALIVSARRPAKDGSLRFRVVVRKATLVVPWIMVARRFSLLRREVVFATRVAAGTGSVVLDVRAAYEICDDMASVARAAGRFMDLPVEDRDAAVRSVLTNQIAAAAVSTTADAIAADGEAFSRRVVERSAEEMKSNGMEIVLLRTSTKSGVDGVQNGGRTRRR